MKKVLILAGSVSDLDKLTSCGNVLDELGISWEITIASAHRSPERVLRLVQEAEEKGTQIFICAAGMAAHLAGMVAAHTLKPVIGIPLSGQAFAGLDALLSTVQMPSGFPVATVALDKAGAANAAWLAARILALSDNALAGTLAEARRRLAEKVEADAAKLAEMNGAVLV